MNNDNLRSLHKTLTDAGYNPPAYEQFAKDMADENNLRGVYSTLQKEGYTPPSFDIFKSDMGFATKPVEESTGTVPDVQGDGFTVIEDKDGNLVPEHQGTTADGSIVRNKERMTPISEMPKRFTPRDESLEETLRSVRQTSADVDRTLNKVRYTQGRSGLDVRVPKIGQSRNVVEHKDFNPMTGRVESEYITETGNVYKDNRAMADVEEHNLEAERRVKWLAGEMAKAKEAYEKAESAQIGDWSRGSLGYGSGGTDHNVKALKEKYEELAKEYADMNWRLNEQNGVNAGVRSQLEDLESKIGNKGELSATGLYASGHGAKPAQSDVNYSLARQINQRTQNILNAAESNVNGRNFFGNLGAGFADAVSDAGTWDFGLSEFAKNYELGRIVDKLEHDKELTADEEVLLNSVIVNQYISAAYGGQLGRGYKAGSVSGESLPFMLEMIINPLAGTGDALAKRFAKGAAKHFAKKSGNRAAVKAIEEMSVEQLGKMFAGGAKWGIRGAKWGGQIVGDILGAAGMTGTTGSVRVAADALGRHLGELKYRPEVKDNGKVELVYDGRENAKGAWQSVREAFGSRFADNHSEMLGEYLTPLGNAVGRVLGRNMGKFSLGRDILDFLKAAKKDDLNRIISEFRERSKFSDGWKEFLEEIGGGTENAVLAHDQTLDTNQDTGLFNLDNLIDTYLGVNVMNAVFGMASLSGYRTGKYRARKSMTNADDAALNAFYGDAGKWGEIRNGIAFGSEEDTKAILKSIVASDEYTDAQKRAALHYAKATSEYKTMRSIEGKQKPENAIVEETPETRALEQEIDENGARGYEATEATDMQDVQNLMELRRDELKEHFGEDIFADIDNDPIRFLHDKTLTDETRKNILAYVNAKAAYDGMLQRVRDDIDSQIAFAHEEINGRVNRETGTVQPAVLKTNDRPVYVVSGHVQMMEDGTMVDNAKSDESIIVRDAETGKLEFVSPHDINRVEQEIDPEQEKLEAEQRIREEVAQTEVDKMNGTLAMNQGDVYELIDEEGKPHYVEIVQNNENGTVAAIVDGEKQEAFPVDVIQQMADVTNKARLAQKLEQEKAGNEANVQEGSGNDYAGGEADLNKIGANNPSATAPDASIPEGDASGTTADENGNSANEEGGEDAMPMIGEGEEAEPDFAGVTPERAHTYIYNESGYSREVANQFVEVNRKAAEKELEKAQVGEPKFGDKNIGTSMAKYNKAMSEWQSKVDAAKEKADYWNRVAEIQSAAEHQRTEEELRELWRTPEGRAQSLAEAKTNAEKIALAKKIYGGYFDDDLGTPGTVYELVSMLLPYGGLNWEGYERGMHHVRGLQEELGSNHLRGFGRNGDTSPFNAYLAKKGEGVSVEEMAEQMYYDPANMLGENARWEDSEIRSAILEVLMDASKPSDIKNYVLDSRINAAEESYRAEEEAAENAEQIAREDEAIRQATNMEPSEYDAFMSSLEESLALQEGYQNSEEYFNQISNEYDRESETNAGTSEEEGAGSVQGQEGVEAGTEADAEEGSGEAGSTFIEAPDGSTVFGNIDSSKHLDEAPIRMLEGDENYGYIHMEKRHGDQIRNQGFKSIEEFVDYVAKNYTRIQEGVDENGNPNKTYLLQVVGKHNETLYIELSKDGSYWNVNSGGVFRSNYGNKLKTVWSASEVQNGESAPDNALRPTSNADKTEGPNGTASNTVSEAKVTDNSANKQGNGEKSATVSEQIAEAEKETDTNPTDAQKEAGNYKKGHVKIDGYDITIENPKGSVRRGKDADGKEWQTTMQNTYGYIRGTEGVDGDHIDVFLSDDPSTGNVYVIDQVNPKTGEFDEHKVMYGFPDIESARKAYLSNYSEGWQGLGNITPVSKEEFKKWVDSSHRKTKPFAEYKNVNTLGETQSENEQQGGQAVTAVLGATDKIDDFGEKIGLARKDTSVSGFKKGEGSEIPAWKKKFRKINLTPEELEAVQSGHVSLSEILSGPKHLARVTGEAYDPNKPFVAYYVEEPKNKWRSPRIYVIRDSEGKVVTFNSEAEYDTAVPVWEVRNQGYRIREEEGKFKIVRPASNGKLVEYAEFDTREEAETYMTSPEGATSLLAKKRENFELPALENLTRNGMPDWRKGKNVTGEDMLETFGFRGGEFGNWVNAAERQQFLNLAYDSLMDLAAELGISPRALSLDGALSIAFGARGRQGAKAHYEPSRAVINMTKMKGAGSLAHEWAHALDNYFGMLKAGRERVHGGENDMWITSAEWSRDPKVRKEVRDIFAEIVDAMRYKTVTRQIDLENAQKAVNDLKVRVDQAVKQYRDQFARGITKYVYNRKTKKREPKTIIPTEEQLAEFDRLMAEFEKNPEWHWDAAKQGWRFGGEIGKQIYELLKDVMPNVKGSYGPAHNAGHRMARLAEANAYLERAKNNQSETVRVKTDFLTGSEKADAGRAGEYYTKQLEMFARAFETYLADKMLKSGRSSDYLTYKKGEVFRSLFGFSPYPAGEELETLSALFDKLFKTLEERIDETSGNTVLFRDDEEEAPIFISNARMAVEGIKQDKATPEQWLAMITKNGGLKAGEDKWLGLSDWLKGQDKKTLTKQEVLDYIRENQIEVHEVEYTEHPAGFEELKKEYDGWLREEGYDYAQEKLHERFGDDAEIAFDDVGGELVINNGDAASVLLGSEKPINETRLGYTTEGLENKKEIALTVPSVESWNESDEVHFGDADYGTAIAWIRFGETRDEDGNRVLVIDEIQSKRHQEGREKGYAVSEEKANAEMDAFLERMRNKYHYEPQTLFADVFSAEEMAELERLNTQQFNATLNRSAVPDAPFEKNWHELAMKRMLRYAAENGYDKVAWTKGEQQARRYDISKTYNYVSYDKERQKLIAGNIVDGVIDYNLPSIDENVAPEKLADYVGKENALKLIENGRLQGEELRIGGEGMKGFYDRMLPSFMNKYGKKWGVKVGEVELPDVEEAGRTMWSVDVTPEMKESVMEGQPMFRESEEQMIERLVDEMGKFAGLAVKTMPRKDGGYNKKQRESYARAEWRRAHRNSAAIAEKLHISDRVVIVDNADGIPEDALKSMSKRGRDNAVNSKGWYDPKTGKIYVILGNHRNSSDVTQTMLHEAVAHYGLRKLFGSHFDTFLDEVFANVSEDIRKKITERAAKKNWDFRTATEEYLASLAEDASFMEFGRMGSGIWQKIKDAFRNMLQSLGLGEYWGDEISDNELRYLLWRSYKNLEEPEYYGSVFGVAEDIAMQAKLSVGNYGKRNVKNILSTGKIDMSGIVDKAAETISEMSVVDKKTSEYDLPLGNKFVSLPTERDRELVRGQRDRMSHTAQWREGVDDVTVHTSLSSLRNKYGDLHAKAKAGDVAAAAELVSKVVKTERIKELVEKHPNAKVAFVHALETTGRNKIPEQYANLFRRFGLSVSDVVQTNKPGHTGTNKIGRFMRRARFDGEVERGKEYILVDDHVTMGGTLRDLKDYIESKGGKVVAVTTLTYSAGGTKLRPTDEQIRQLTEKGITNEQLKELGIADSTKGLTRSEARELLVLANSRGNSRTSRRREEGAGRRLGVDEETLRRESDAYLVSDENSSDVSEEEYPLFRDEEDYDAGPMTFEESVTNAMLSLAAKNKSDLQARMDAMRALGGNLQKLRQAMARQREYDKQTVNEIVRLARMMIDSGFVSEMTPTEVKRLLAMVSKAAGKEDITAQAEKVVDLITEHQLRQCRNILGRQVDVRAAKLNASGVEVQGKLDVEGQRMVSAMKDGIKLDKESVDEMISDALEKMNGEDETIAKNASLAYQGLLLARQYHEDIKDSELEEKRLRQELKEAEENWKASGTNGQFISYENYKEYVASVNDAIRLNRLERISAYHRLYMSIGTGLRVSVAKAQEFRERETARANEIRHNANSDLEGKSKSEHSTKKWWEKAANWSAVRFLMKPLATFDEMLRFFGSKSVDGRGYLWTRFFRDGYVKCNDTAWRNLKAAHEELDEKVREVFGRNDDATYTTKNGKQSKLPKIKRWSDLFSLERDMPGAVVTFRDAGEETSYTLTQGNMLYIYMVNKMSDGRMKLRRMGITEEMVDEIKEHLDPRFIELADWMQNDFLVKKRNGYNAIHERLFGAPMAAIENYFPLKINSRSRGKEVDPTAYNQNEDAKPSEITGAIIKRRRNSLPLDITHADAFDVMLEHLQKMEHWAAFAEMNHDLKTLLSYKTFRNRVMNMNSVRFGSGETLWKNFEKVCAIAAGVYTPQVDRDSIDTTFVNVAKGVTMAKISLRLFTAFKQLLSYPAYLSEASVKNLALYTNPIGAYQAWKWAIKELPGFAERWQSRQAGDSRLKDTESDWELWRSDFSKLASRVGMSPNAFVDAVTVAIGAKAIYETKLKQFIKDGYPKDVAQLNALREASVSYNETQQSSENGYLSAMQLDRTAASVALTWFRNASMGYQRRFLRSLDNLHRKMKKGYKQESIAYMAKQMVREGLDESKAMKAAERAYRRSWVEDFVNVAMFGYGLQLAWNLGSYLPYLLFGDDDDKKKEFVDDAAIHAFAGGIEGLSGGNVMSELANMSLQLSMTDDSDEEKSLTQKILNYDLNLLPVIKDVQTTLRHFGKDNVEGWGDVINLLIQSNIGLNPQTLTDACLAIEDAVGGDLETAKEIGFMLLRMANIPQSQLEELYLDEVGLTAADAKELSVEELAQRYAVYKRKRGAYGLRWAYSDEAKAELEEKYVKRFQKRLQERIHGLDEIEQKEAFETAYADEDIVLKNIVGKELAKTMDVKDYFGKDTDEAWIKEYQRVRTLDDFLEDAVLTSEAKYAKDANDEPRMRQIADVRKDLNELRKRCVLDIDGRESYMEKLRKIRKAFVDALAKGKKGAVKIEVK